jgi:uncharacterized protein YndB with AHSA1/START domain
LCFHYSTDRTGMTEKKKFELEYVFKSSPSILYRLLSTPDGLAEWFADDVNVQDEIYTFDWAGEEVTARLISSKSGEYMRWSWLEDDDEEGNTYFEIRVKLDPMTKMSVVLITDFAEEDEIEEAKQLWETQINDLKRIIGA